jgi:hypothetical protein
MLTIKTILRIQEILEENNAGFRKLPGTAIKTSVVERQYTFHRRIPIE